ncbi:MAG TPA: hypothetical protein K8V05_06005 [Butyricimonas virosa]|uniref:Uncharacterized protein n=1 Tax=Butyricimonas virosa TaxID=544645 RepID=A0A921H3X1_9BACT|nr:hypothetical protein [Butyricimonas virosa]
MKRNLLSIGLIFCLLFVAKGMVGQSVDSLAQCKSMEDTLRFIQSYILKQKEQLIGKPAGVTFEAFKKILPINFAALSETSSWVDPKKKGNCYVNGITLFYMTEDEIHIAHGRKKKVLHFAIYFEDTNVISYDFEHSIPEEDWENYPKYVDYFKHFIVKRIVIDRIDWNDPKGDMLRETVE